MRIANEWKATLEFRCLGDPNLDDVIDEIAKWGEALKARSAPWLRPRWLTLIGGCGTGKTHCARRLFAWGAKRFNWSDCDYHHRVIYWPQFVAGLKAGRFDERDDMMNWPLLVLDDILASRDASGFATDELNTILGVRMDKWTILTTNLTMVAIEKLDSRMASRIARPPNQWIEINAPDFAARQQIDNDPGGFVIKGRSRRMDTDRRAVTNDE